jgi:hypothetical protein
MRRLLSLLAPLLLLAAAGCARADGPVAVEARPVAAGQRLGSLELLAALELTSRDRRLGGLSGLLVEDARLTAVSDRGELWTASLDRDARGTLTAARAWRVERATSDPSADLEALARRPDGTLIATAESPPRLLGVGGPAPAEAAAFAAAFASLPLNEGVEALAILADGGILAIAEAPSARPGRHLAAIFRGGAVTRLAYRPAAGFKPTGADRIGDVLLVLERRLSLLGGLEGRIVAVDLASARLEPGAVVEGRELARLGVDSLAENFEGIAAGPGPGGAIDIYVVSDDNFLPVQRTLLLQLRWRR